MVKALESINTPPTDNMGVENKTTWHIDYLTITVWDNDLPDIFNAYFYKVFSKLRNLEHGGRFYKETYQSDLGIMIRCSPVGDLEKRSTIEMPGLVCQSLGYDKLVNFYQYLCRNYNKVRINRIDLAFDYCKFSVKDIQDAIVNDDLRSYFKRSTYRFYDSPFEINELGETGTSGVTLGGRSSTRYMRVYDKHGYTRLEVEFKAEKAEQVGIDILMAGTTNEALKCAVGHLRDYIDFFNDWWDEFIDNFDRMYKKLPKSIKELCTFQIKNWFESQIASAFYVMNKLEGAEYFDNLYLLGAIKYKNSRFSGIVECYTEVK